MDEQMMKRFQLAKKNTMTLKVIDDWGTTKATVGQYQIKAGDELGIKFPDGSVVEFVVHIYTNSKKVPDMWHEYDVVDKVPYIHIDYRGMKVPVDLKEFDGMQIENIIPSERRSNDK